MASTSMPPPPSPLAHRRTTRLSSSLNPKDQSSCLPPRNMSLSKGATFHCPSSPATDVDPVVSIPHLLRRAPTCSHSSLSAFLTERREEAAQYIADFEQTFSGARGHRGRNRQRTAEAFQETLKHLTVSSSLVNDEGLGSSVSSPASDKSLARVFARVGLASNKDSALGNSVAARSQADDGQEAASSSVVADNDDRVAATLIKETDPTGYLAPAANRQSGTERRRAPAVQNSHFANPYLPSAPAEHPFLSRFARKKINELLVQPLLDQDRFTDFHPLVTRLAKRTHKNIRCLRDLEQSLIIQPLTRGFSVSPDLYRSFSELTVQLTVDTFAHLSESDQRRATDQPYTSGYFLDLVQQVQQLAAHIGRARPASDLESDQDDSAPTVDDEITLEGGLGSSDHLAELVRWRNGKGISLRTGQPYEPVLGVKRQHSAMSPEEAIQSMARRKKGYIPEIIDMPCSDPTCDKVFNRKCDLAKHEKTHSRPYKCQFAGCKYAEIGLPTEKELERHTNDKHDPNPMLYKCNFCEFKTKRESNCKQHMEKKHNWDYRRAKGKDKDVSSVASRTPHTPAMDYSPAVAPSPTHTGYAPYVDDHSSVSGSIAGSAFTPYEEPINDFNFNAPLFPPRPSPGNPFASMDPVGGDFTNQAYMSPAMSAAANMHATKEGFHGMTPQTPAYSTITQSPYVDAGSLAAGPSAAQPFWPTPDSAPQHSYSRHASVHLESPAPMQQSLSHDPMMGTPLLANDLSVPDADFALFGNAFSNPAGAEQTLFPSALDNPSQMFDPEMFAKIENFDMDMELNDEFDEMIDFDRSAY